MGYYSGLDLPQAYAKLSTQQASASFSSSHVCSGTRFFSPRTHPTVSFVGYSSFFFSLNCCPYVSILRTKGRRGSAWGLISIAYRINGPSISGGEFPMAFVHVARMVWFLLITCCLLPQIFTSAFSIARNDNVCSFFQPFKNTLFMLTNSARCVRVNHHTKYHYLSEPLATGAKTLLVINKG